MYRAGWDFEELLYGDHPLGWDTIGTEKVIRSVTQADFKKHRDQLYTAGNLVVTFAGNITEKKAMELASQYFGAIEGKRDRSFEAFKTYGKKQVFLREKNTEQAHLVLGVPGISAMKDEQYTQKLLSVILGGNMSSRMFLNIREAKGLCYYIATEVDSYLDAGSLSTRAGVDQSRLDEAITSIIKEYSVCAKDGVTDEELTRAKAFFRGKTVLGMEDSEEVAHFIGKQQLLYPKVLTIEEYLKKIDAVTLEQVNALAKKLLKQEELRLVVIGKDQKEEHLTSLLH